MWDGCSGDHRHHTLENDVAQEFRKCSDASTKRNTPKTENIWVYDKRAHETLYAKHTHICTAMYEYLQMCARYIQQRMMRIRNNKVISNLMCHFKSIRVTTYFSLKILPIKLSRSCWQANNVHPCGILKNSLIFIVRVVRTRGGERLEMTWLDLHCSLNKQKKKQSHWSIFASIDDRYDVFEHCAMCMPFPMRIFRVSLSKILKWHIK